MGMWLKLQKTSKHEALSSNSNTEKKKPHNHYKDLIILNFLKHILCVLDTKEDPEELNHTVSDLREFMMYLWYAGVVMWGLN
jgi:hypothetical protein